MSYEGTEEEKLKFARALAQHGEPFRAARSVFTGYLQGGLCGHIADVWPVDPIVTAELARLNAAKGEFSDLPDRSETAKLIMELARDPHTERELRLRAIKLYCDVRGFVEKAPTAVVNNNNTQQVAHVMLMPARHVDWEERLAQQQHRLIEDARSNK